MNLDETKEYLLQIRDIDKKIASLKRSIEQCEERATSITTAYNELPPQHNGAISQKVASNAERAVDYETDVKTLKEKAEQLKIKISREIYSMPNNTYSALLRDYYINGLPWEDVAENIGKDSDYTRKVLHPNALKEFEIIFLNKPANTRKYPFIP